MGGEGEDHMFGARENVKHLRRRNPVLQSGPYHLLGRRVRFHPSRGRLLDRQFAHATEDDAEGPAEYLQ